MPSSSASRTYRAVGVVLRTYKLGEADRIIVLLTREQGQVRAVAKGVRRTSSKFGSRLEPFMSVDLQLAHGRNLDVITQVETKGAYGYGIAADYASYTAATAIAETAERLTDIGETGGAQYALVVGAFSALSRNLHPSELILDSYLLRALATAGWAPSFTDCARCGAPGPHTAFSAPLGGAVCPACRPPGAASPSSATMDLLGALLTGDWAIADASDAGARREAAGLVAAYLQWHLERGVASLKYVERV
ncbi:DNA repair protein RecO [Arthrobacter agilis]|uniref:DNA repair protein RecO n=1 Tax=Arthrobacter agilis TaxID=37921 RepID=UPI000B3552E6|nr:DNA repair protein RecO [Arthrobacter agilis]OUM45203.1 DNA repair protein RecO [Arthrobacter agilis]PPB47534.1 DNA repair protein RecO [Arthrobacter agilis]TPV21690.1 DNA repair protein RecO [Arthrobacter agilis]VDR32135.1 Recombination protein O [Arthrobacter agilis]